MYGVLFTIPDATSSLAQIGAWSNPLFTEFLPFIWIGVGVIVIGLIIGFIFGR